MTRGSIAWSDILMVAVWVAFCSLVVVGLRTCRDDNTLPASVLTEPSGRSPDLMPGHVQSGGEVRESTNPLATPMDFRGWQNFANLPVPVLANQSGLEKSYGPSEARESTLEHARGGQSPSVEIFTERGANR